MTNDESGKTYLITGGTGSFGQTVTQTLLDRGATEVRILSRDEAKQDAMRHRFGDPRLRFFLGDVRDRESVSRASQGVDCTFHAAALKQVPSGEFFPMEVVRTNVIGTSNVVRASEDAGVASLVCLSTDKAVYPINAMGMSKALMEKVAQSHGLNHPSATTIVSCVRYGNVMYSRGSVIPLFVSQILRGDPLTVTDASMTRFMMSLAESVDLVELAFEQAEQGDTFVRKAPACTVGDLATAISRICGVEPRVVQIGTRHAEKSAETLASAAELARADDLGHSFRIRPDSRDLNYAPYFEEGSPRRDDIRDFDSDSAQRLSLDELEELLLRVPEIAGNVSEWRATVAQRRVVE